MVVGELEEVRRGGWDEGVCRVRSVKNGLAAKRLSCSAACKESATQEQRNGPLAQSKASKGGLTRANQDFHDRLALQHQKEHKEALMLISANKDDLIFHI